MSELTDLLATIDRLNRRLSRERSARRQAEEIAERVASDRWALREQLEDKLALRTAELEAARQTASEAITDRRRDLSALSHNLRTSLTALYYLAESLCEEEPLTAQQIQDLRCRLADMQAVMDAAAGTSPSPDTGGEPDPATCPPGVAFKDIVAAHEGGWHQLAAQSGKLLILAIDTSNGEFRAGTPDEVNEHVLGLIRARLDSPESVIELHLTAGPEGLALSDTCT